MRHIEMTYRASTAERRFSMYSVPALAGSRESKARGCRNYTGRNKMYHHPQIGVKRQFFEVVDEAAMQETPDQDQISMP